MVFSDSFLQELKLKNDIEEIIGQHVQLKGRGSRLVGLCPFHSEKTPSFTVFPESQTYHCFGCGAGGDVITFMREYEHLDYPDAVRALAKRANMEVPDSPGDEAGTRLIRERVLSANRLAARFFHETLMSEQGKEALSYLTRRGLSHSTIRRFGLGYAPESWNALLRRLEDAGYTREEIKQSHLAAVGKQGGLYDYFRNRIMFPIIDLRGGVIAFGGRVMDDSQPKYLNSPDTPVFKKSNNLFALNFAKGNGGERLILTEGYMDVISLHQAGFTGAVATLGTAITPPQARLISRYTKEIVVAYDSDRAGQAATSRAIGFLTEAGLSVKVLKLTGGKDPDEFIKTFGPERFKLLIEGSGGHVEFRLAQALQNYDVDRPEERVKYLKEAVGILASLRSPLERDVYAGRLSQELSVTKDAILAELSRELKKRAKAAQTQAVRKETGRIYGQKNRVNPEKPQHIKAARAEEALICLLFFFPDYYSYIRERIGPDDFVTQFNRRVFGFLCDTLETGGSLDTVIMGQAFDVQEMGLITGILSQRAQLMGSREEADELIATVLSEKSRLAAADILHSDADALQDYIRNEMRTRKKGGA